MHRHAAQRNPVISIVTAFISIFLMMGHSPAALSQGDSIIPEWDIWAEVKIAGQPVGYYHEKAETGKNGDISTFIEMVLTINRMDGKVEMRTSAEYQESMEGRLITIKSETSSSKQSTLLEVAVGDGSLLIRTTSGGKSYDRKVPYAGTLVGQEAIRRMSLEGLKSPGDKILYQTFMPELGAVASIARRVIAVEQLTIEGRRWSTLKVEDVIENLPGKTTTWLDGTGKLLRQIQESPLGEIETIRTNQAQAQKQDFSTSILPAEAYGRTLARSNILLPHERSIEYMKVRITHRKPELGWPNLESDNQRIFEKTPESVVLEIWRPTLTAKARRPVKSTPELASFLE